MSTTAPPDLPQGIPKAEVDIDLHLVHALLQAQHPDLADLDLRLHGSGWDNVTYRLGAHLAVRLPRRELGVELLLKEQRWLPELAPVLPLPIPAPVRVGRAAMGYPWPWSIVPWVGGRDAVVEPLRSDQAPPLARLLRALHHPAPPDAPRNSYRGGPLSDRKNATDARLARIKRGSLSIDLTTVAAAWEQARAVPIDVDDVWIHGDAHPRNVIAESGELRALVDWGDMGLRDPATDLAAAWMLFEEQTDFRAAYGPVSAATWERARGWAIHLGVMLIDSGDQDDPEWAEVGRRTLERAC